MCSEHRTDLAVRKPAQSLVARRTRHAPSEQRMPDSEPPAEARESAPMLLGEQFGRRHHRRLMPTFDRANHRPEGNERLAAADVAHQHAIHLVGAGEIGADFLDRARLRSGQRKGQLLDHLRAQALRAVERNPDASSAAEPLDRKCELEGEKLIECERAMPRRVTIRQRGEIGVGRRIVKITQARRGPWVLRRAVRRGSLHGSSRPPRRARA